MTSHRSQLIAIILAAAFTAPALANAEPRLVQAPSIRSTQARRALIRRARSQRIAPRVQAGLVNELKAMSVDSSAFQKKISTAPLQVRMKVFQHFAAAANTPSAGFDRRLRGMAKVNGKNRVQKAKKSFFEVSGDNLELFRKVLGKNVLWFAVNSSPGHLHTLMSDQGDGTKFHHNTYGTSTNDATVTGNLTQYALPVLLTDNQMKRFTSYFNAGMKAEAEGYGKKTNVYGFFARGKKIDKIACTNWVTSASIGSLPRWARTIDKRMKAQAGVPAVVTEKGLHGALAAAGTPEARQTLVTAVLANRMTKWNRSAVKRMAKAFTKHTTNFPNLPQDLILRDALAKTLGLGRSQDPAKWSYDLLMSKKSPIVAILNGTRKGDALKNMEFNMEIMGTVQKNGWVKKNTSGYFGSNPPPNAGGLGVIPDGRSSAVQPAAAAE